MTNMVRQNTNYNRLGNYYTFYNWEFYLPITLPSFVTAVNICNFVFYGKSTYQSLLMHSSQDYLLSPRNLNIMFTFQMRPT